jgi:hypothetical protein
LAQFVIDEKQQEEISALCQIAQHNGSALTLGEVLEATSMAATEEDLEAAWAMNPVLSASYALESGWILEKGSGTVDPTYSAAAAMASEKRSAMNVRQAADFAAVCVDRRVRLLAVSGGNSYRRAGPGDDVDFFSVTANDSVWIFMLRSLILARIHGLRRKHSAPFCFSFVVEERKALSDFGRADDRLFARDALMARVLSGWGFYQSLLSQSGWMERYFPALYHQRVSGQTRPASPETGQGNSVLNYFLYCSLGSYVRLKAFLLNARLRREGRVSAAFHADIGRDRCVYESNRYRRLREMYRKIGDGYE